MYDAANIYIDWINVDFGNESSIPYEVNIINV